MSQSSEGGVEQQGISAADAAAWGADAQAPAEQDGNILARITGLVGDAKKAQAEVTLAEEALKRAQEKHRELVEFLIPNAMVEARQEKLRTLDGDTVELAETLVASIPKAQEEPAFMWLTANGQGSIIKRELKILFGKGEDQKAAEAADLLRGSGFAPADKRSVHPQTLAAAIREMLAEGREVPLELLGVFVRRMAKIKPA